MYAGGRISGAEGSESVSSHSDRDGHHLESDRSAHSNLGNHDESSNTRRRIESRVLTNDRLSVLIRTTADARGLADCWSISSHVGGALSACRQDLGHVDVISKGTNRARAASPMRMSHSRYVAMKKAC